MGMKNSPVARASPKSNKKFGIFREARTRILIWYAISILSLGMLSIPLFRHLIIQQVNTRVRKDLQEEVVHFRKAFEQWKSIPARQQEPIETFINNFLATNLPEDDDFLLFYLGDPTGIRGAARLYKHEPLALPKLLRPGSQLIDEWSKVARAERGEKTTSDTTIGTILYIVEPFTSEGEIDGSFVALHTTAGELQEAREIFQIFVPVLALVIIIAYGLGWIATGKVLEPIHQLAVTARGIGKKDLTKRIRVQGSGEMAELARTFNRMLDRLQAVFESQRNFLRDASHELRTPITVIRGHLELMEDDLPAEQKPTLQLLFGELDRMSRLVRDLSLLAKTERPDFLKLDTVEVGELTEELYQKAKTLGERNWQLRAQARGEMRVDRQKFTEAVMNLVENATQHTQEGDSIVLGSTLTPHELRFWVRDTGEGIAPEEQKRIFERFFRGSNPHSPGSGLGLSIVRAIVKAHGGRVQLWSEPHFGSEFTIVIPLLRT